MKFLGFMIILVVLVTFSRCKDEEETITIETVSPSGEKLETDVSKGIDGDTKKEEQEIQETDFHFDDIWLTPFSFPSIFDEFFSVDMFPRSNFFRFPNNMMKCRNKQRRDIFEKLSMKDSVEEDENEIKLMIELPGVKKEDVKLEIEGNTLKVDATRGNYNYNQEYVLDNQVDTSQIEAKLELGLLEIKMFKTPEITRLIEIF